MRKVSIIDTFNIGIIADMIYITSTMYHNSMNSRSAANVVAVPELSIWLSLSVVGVVSLFIVVLELL